MAGGSLGTHAAGMGWDYLTDSPAPPPQEQLFSAVAGATGGPDPTRRIAPSLLGDRVPQGNLFDFSRGTGAATADDLARQSEEAANRRVAGLVEEQGGRWTSANRGSPLGQRAEAISESSPFSVDIWTRHHEKGKGALNQLVEETFPTRSSRQVAGERAALGFGEAKARTDTYIDALYENLDRALRKGSLGGERTPINMDALIRIADDYDRVVQEGGEFADLIFQDPDLKGAVDAIRRAQQSGEMPSYDTIKQLRTIIGRKVGNNFGQTGEAVGQKRLYGALKEDLINAREQIGGESARLIGEQADDAFAKYQTVLSEVDPVFKNADNPTQLYEAFSRSVVNRPGLARKVKEVLPEGDWNRLVDTYMYRLTRGNPGAQDVTGELVSPRTTVSNLARLKQQSPEGYALLTEGRRDALDVIERLAGGLSGAETYLNRSQTAGALQGSQFVQEIGTGTTGALAGLATGQGGTAAGIGALAAVAARPILARMYARALTSPNLAKALSKIGKARDVLPTGTELARALIAAGADKQEVEEIFNGTE
jgi:hypothetical protein